MSASNLHSAWARLFVASLASAGVAEAVVSPGSRSTPLALALAAEKRIRVHVVVDERAAAFFALGQARVTGRPSVLVCTSGSAPAHWLPAIVEAEQAFVPMVCVSADRPLELQDAAASQTIDQTKLFGAHVRHFAELGAPCASPAALRSVVRIAAQAVARALGPTPGPVHVNARFRKPLEPVAVSAPEPFEPLVAELVERGVPEIIAPPPLLDAASLDALAARLDRAERGVVVCGPARAGDDPRALREAALALCRATGFPLLAEATSQARFGGRAAGVTAIGAFDALFRDADLRARLAPDLAIEVGAPPVSAAWAALVEAKRFERIVVAAHGYNDPSSSAATLAMGDPAATLAALAMRVQPARAASRATYARALAAADASAWSLVEEDLAAPAFSEGVVARTVADAAPEGSILVVGNSRPVRDLDAFAPPSSRALRVLHQRGAAGIDGLLAGACGARSVAREPMTLLFGDVSFLHDVGSLAVARGATGPLAIVVVNNDGGRIFEDLPVAADPARAAVLERCFVTPHGLDFEGIVRGFGVGYARAERRDDLARALAAAYASDRPLVIEAVVPPRDGAIRAARLRARIAEAARQAAASFVATEPSAPPERGLAGGGS